MDVLNFSKWKEWVKINKIKISYLYCCSLFFLIEKIIKTEVTDFYVNKGTFTALDSKPNSDNIDLPELKENHGSCTPALS